MRPWLAYRRVSRVGDRADTLISPAEQLRSIEAYAARRGFAIDVLEPELDVSGAKQSRPILDAALERVDAGVAQGVIVSHLDRLSRLGIADALRVIARIENSGGQVIAVAENFDATTPEGEMARNMFLSVNHMYWRRARLGFANAKRQAVERGIWPTATVPIGYRRGKDRRLVVVPSAAEKVRAAFEARATGASYAAIGRRFLSRGSSGARKVITNRVYLGEVRLNVEGEEVVTEQAHAPIIDRATWEAAQVSHPRPARRGSEPPLLAGLIRCAGCRASMVRGGSERFGLVYRCADRQASQRCPAPAIVTCTLIEPYVEDLALGQIEQLHIRGHARKADAQAAEAALEAAEAELAAFQDAVSAAEIGAQSYARGMRRRVEDVEMARRRLGEARSAAMPEIDGASIRALWPSLSVGDRNHVLRGALSVVWVRKGRGDLARRVRVIGAGHRPADLPRPGTRGTFASAEWPDGDLPGEIRPAAA